MLNLINLEKARPYMLQEFQNDLNSKEGIYLGAHLNNIGKEKYPTLLKDAIINYNEQWLIAQ